MAHFTGKWPKEQVEILIAAYRQFLNNCGHTLAEIQDAYRDVPEMKVMYQIDRLVTYDLQYDNNHPAYHPGEWEKDGVMQERPARTRLVDHNPNFIFYPKGCNDNHRVALLKYVGKEVGLI